MVGGRIGHLDDTKVRMRKMVREGREFVSHKNRDMSGFGCCYVQTLLLYCIQESQLRRKERERREGREQGEKKEREKKDKGETEQTMKPAIYRYPPLPPFPPCFLHAKKKEGRKSPGSNLHLSIPSSFAPVPLKQQLLKIFTLELMTHQILTFL